MTTTMAADPAHIAMLLEGTEKWNAWRAANPQIRPNLRRATLSGGTYNNYDLRDALLIQTQLNGASLEGARLEGANLDYANLEGARLRDAHLEGASLREANLGGADLRGIFFGKTTKLDRVLLYSSKPERGSVLLADADWGSVNLGVINWDEVKEIGDEQRARRLGDVEHYREALRCYRQLSAELRRQGLGEEADRFAYRGQLLQRMLLLKQENSWWRKWSSYLFSLLLDVLVGYGYMPGRSLRAYFGTLAAFTLFYHFVPNSGIDPTSSSTAPTPLSWSYALLFSLISFHGRVNAPGTLSFTGLYAWISILETIIGLIIELAFIAAFTQRFLGGKS
jgi:hypothetical protein